MCVCNPSNRSIWCNKCMPKVSSRIYDVNPISEAEVYLSYGKIDQAIQILEEAVINPIMTAEEEDFNRAVYLILLDCYAKKNDKQKFSTAVTKLSEIIYSDHPFWKIAIRLAESFDVTLPIARSTESFEVTDPPDHPESPANQVSEMKQILIARLINLGVQTKLPGFDDDFDKTFSKFKDMPDVQLLTFFELIAIQAHKAGFQ